MLFHGDSQLLQHDEIQYYCRRTKNSRRALSAARLNGLLGNYTGYARALKDDSSRLGARDDDFQPRAERDGDALPSLGERENLLMFV
jgi:hypothetical protein